jgi:hypothetical protein
MTTILRIVQQFLDSGDSDKAREEIDRAFGNLRKGDSHVREFAALLTLGSIEAWVRKMNKEYDDIFHYLQFCEK